MTNLAVQKTGISFVLESTVRTDRDVPSFPVLFNVSNTVPNSLFCATFSGYRAEKFSFQIRSYTVSTLYSL